MAIVLQRQALHPVSGHQTPHIHRRKLVFSLSLVFIASLYAGNPIKVIVGILASPADQKVFLLIDQVPACIFTLFKIWDKLDRIGRTGLLAHPTINTAREIDPEEFRIATILSRRVLSGLKRDALDRTSRRAEVAGDTALFSVRISGQDNASAPAWGQIGSLFWILNRDRLRKGPFKDDPETHQEIAYVAKKCHVCLVFLVRLVCLVLNSTKQTKESK
jgi:hypothetical protein